MKKIFIFVLLIFSLWAPPVRAKSDSWGFYLPDVSRLNIEVNLDQQGDALITKTFTFLSPITNFVWVEDLDASKIEVFQGGNKILPKNLKIKKENDRQIIEASANVSSVSWSIVSRNRRAVRLGSEHNRHYDQIYLSAVLEPGIYIDNLEIVINLPTIVDPSRLALRAYAIHGVTAYDFQVKDEKTLSFSGREMSPTAIYTLSVDLPPGTFHYSLSKRIYFFLRLSAFNLWLLVAIILPLCAIFFYLYLLISKRKAKDTSSLRYLERPPDDLPPALVGLLLRETVTQRDIVATILDLAQRGFIEIVKKPDEYVLGKRGGKGQLNEFERYLYDKLFTQEGVHKIKRTASELSLRATQQLYSPKITSFYQLLYQEVKRRGYFRKNPGWVILRYRVYGIFFFLLAVALAVLSVIVNPERPYGIFGAVGQMIAAVLIIKIAPLMPKKTQKGKNELLLWLSFGRFLSDERPLQAGVLQEYPFEKYLPYAVALEKEIEWTKRFSEVWYVPPSWYISNENVTVESLAGSLFYITGYLSHILYGLREPTL
jgi:hypothetical protein